MIKTKNWKNQQIFILRPLLKIQTKLQMVGFLIAGVDTVNTSKGVTVHNFRYIYSNMYPNSVPNIICLDARIEVYTAKILLW